MIPGSVPFRTLGATLSGSAVPYPAQGSRTTYVGIRFFMSSERPRRNGGFLRRSFRSLTREGPPEGIPPISTDRVVSDHPEDMGYEMIAQYLFRTDAKARRPSLYLSLIDQTGSPAHPRPKDSAAGGRDPEPDPRGQSRIADRQPRR